MKKVIPPFLLTDINKRRLITIDAIAAIHTKLL